MKVLSVGSMAVAFIVLSGMVVCAQGPGWGPGMMGGYGPGGYGMGPGMMGGWESVNIPPKLPAPKNARWIKKLREIYSLEKESLAQYTADQEKFNTHMPYVMVIPQEEDHVLWIGRLFAAYGLSSNGKVPGAVKSGTPEEAYRRGIKMEADLLPRYEWLIKNAGDRDTSQTLNTILIQSRWHMAMFEHALSMGGGGYGLGRGRGMMGGYGGYGPGMMGGYGPGPGRYWQGQSEACKKFLDETSELRKDLQNKRYDYHEALRKTGTTPESLAKKEKEILALQEKIYARSPQGCWW